MDENNTFIRCPHCDEYIQLSMNTEPVSIEYYENENVTFEDIQTYRKLYKSIIEKFIQKYEKKKTDSGDSEMFKLYVALRYVMAKKIDELDEHPYKELLIGVYKEILHPFYEEEYEYIINEHKEKSRKKSPVEELYDEVEQIEKQEKEKKRELEKNLGRPRKAIFEKEHYRKSDFDEDIIAKLSEEQKKLINEGLNQYREQVQVRRSPSNRIFTEYYSTM